MARSRTLTVKESIARETRWQTAQEKEQARVEAHIEAYLRAGTVQMIALRDGVFPFEDIRKDKGDEFVASPEVAAILIGNGHARKA